MYLKDPFVIGPAPELTEDQKRTVALDKEWREAGSVKQKRTVEATARTPDEVAAMSDREFEKAWRRLGVSR